LEVVSEIERYGDEPPIELILEALCICTQRLDESNEHSLMKYIKGADFYFNRGVSHFASGMYEQAVDCFDHAIKLKCNNPKYREKKNPGNNQR
jgi:tetratricopeptide (TPR) repeat protein